MKHKYYGIIYEKDFWLGLFIILAGLSGFVISTITIKMKPIYYTTYFFTPTFPLDNERGYRHKQERSSLNYACANVLK